MPRRWIGPVGASLRECPGVRRGWKSRHPAKHRPARNRNPVFENRGPMQRTGSLLTPAGMMFGHDITTDVMVSGAAQHLFETPTLFSSCLAQPSTSSARTLTALHLMMHGLVTAARAGSARVHRPVRPTPTASTQSVLVPGKSPREVFVGLNIFHGPSRELEPVQVNHPRSTKSSRCTWHKGHQKRLSGLGQHSPPRARPREARHCNLPSVKRARLSRWPRLKPTGRTTMSPGGWPR
ncbi:hypothetical protein DPEC_G00361430 [Dallia pectoralis]|uniref:Uncharacterized protein n=1 Tax=Dallia pectoralis TaxID=75939 RepID=A0ACC2F151_DALPE|nr:hypothetical protein DPEC_G00361430 [Dallia pectoralis]